jgi:hypothetical protein
MYLESRMLRNGVRAQRKTRIESQATDDGNHTSINKNSFVYILDLRIELIAYFKYMCCIELIA